MGSGKSVMFANIVDDPMLHCESKAASVAFFFCRHDLPESLKARTVIGALLRQAIRLFLRALKDEKFYDRGYLSYTEMIEIMQQILPINHTVYIVLDGLHLCDHLKQEAVTKQLQTMQETGAARLCISLWLEPDRLKSISSYIPKMEIVSSLDNTPDIDAFIHEELGNCLERQTLILGNTGLILDIYEALSKGSKGMFLWVALQTKALCAVQTDEEIKNALNDLPEDLSVIYDRILQKCPSSGKQYKRRIFELIAVAQRPLETEELREALNVRSGDTIWTASKLVNDIYSAMTSCGCLLLVDKEERTVRFMHPSVEQFLFDTYKDSEGSGTTIEACYRSMADILVTYLSYGIFWTDLSTTRVPEMNVGSAPVKIIESTVGSSRSGQNLALKLLKLRKRPSLDAGKVIAKELSSHKGLEHQEFHLYKYAKKSYLTHLVEVREMSLHMTRLFPDLLQRGDGSGSDLPSSSMAYMKALESGNTEMVRMVMIGSNMLDPNDFIPSLKTNDGTSYTRLGIAICTNSEKVVDIHRRVIGNPPLTYVRAIETSMCEVAFRGSTEVVQRMLQTPRAHYWLRHICKCGRGLLACAIWGTNNDVLKLLLDTGKLDINAGPFERSAVWEAVARKNTEALYLLFEHRKFYLTEHEIIKLKSLAKETGDEVVYELVEAYCTYKPWKTGLYEVSRANIVGKGGDATTNWI